MNTLLVRAQTWFTELEIKTKECEGLGITGPLKGTLMVNRDGIDKLCGIGVVYDVFLNELRSSLGTNKFSLVDKDREWLYIDTF